MSVVDISAHTFSFVHVSPLSRNIPGPSLNEWFETPPMSVDELVQRHNISRLRYPLLRDETEWSLDEVAAVNLLPTAEGNQARGQADQGVLDALNESFDSISPYTSAVVAEESTSISQSIVAEESTVAD